MDSKGLQEATNRARAMLAVHDWFWRYADDPRAYRIGLERESELHGLLLTLPTSTANELWDAAAPRDIERPWSDTIKHMRIGKMGRPR